MQTGTAAPNFQSRESNATNTPESSTSERRLRFLDVRAHGACSGAVALHSGVWWRRARRRRRRRRQQQRVKEPVASLSVSRVANSEPSAHQSLPRDKNCAVSFGGFNFAQGPAMLLCGFKADVRLMKKTAIGAE